MAKAVLTRKQIAEDPNLFWNAFIDVVGGPDDEARTPLQQHCHLCFRYYNEVMNGGHFQLFENNGIDYAKEVLKSLHGLGLTEVAKILDGALDIAAARRWQEIESVESFVEQSAEGLFEQHDDAFYALSPDLFELLYAIGERQPDAFFTIVP